MFNNKNEKKNIKNIKNNKNNNKINSNRINNNRINKKILIIVFLFGIIYLSNNTYAGFDEDLLFENLYESQLEMNQKYSNDLDNYLNYSFVYNTLYNRLNEKKNNKKYLDIYISDNNYFFYKNKIDNLWILKYNTINLESNGFKNITKNKISNIVFTYDPSILKKYNCYENFVTELKNELNKKKEVLFVMNESLSGKVVSSVINFGRIFVKNGLFYQKEIFYGTIQGNNSNKLTLEDLTNESIMFYFDDFDYDNNYCNDIYFDNNDNGDYENNYEDNNDNNNETNYEDNSSSNLIYVKDSLKLLEIIDYLTLELIGVKI